MKVLGFSKIQYMFVLIFSAVVLAVLVGFDIWRDRNVFTINNIIVALVVLYGLFGTIAIRAKEKNNA